MVNEIGVDKDFISPSEFVEATNQIFEELVPFVFVEGEVRNLSISRNKWLYFDISDSKARVKCFGTVFNLPGPIEEGMVVKVEAVPRMSHKYGFSLNIHSLSYSGEGTIKRAYDLLKNKLDKEGLFDDDRKRSIPELPNKIGLIASSESAGYKDFIKVLEARIGGLEIKLFDVAVQGRDAENDIVNAVEYFDINGRDIDVLVIIRGGGSADDLQAFDNERVVRAIATSTIPTVVAIGHERDIVLSELAADLRASTPSNAAELIVPNRVDLRAMKNILDRNIYQAMTGIIDHETELISDSVESMTDSINLIYGNEVQRMVNIRALLEGYNPANVVRRGYAIIRRDGRVVSDRDNLLVSAGVRRDVDIEIRGGHVKATVEGEGY